MNPPPGQITVARAPPGPAARDPLLEEDSYPTRAHGCLALKKLGKGTLQTLPRQARLGAGKLVRTAPGKKAPSRRLFWAVELPVWGMTGVGRAGTAPTHPQGSWLPKGPWEPITVKPRLCPPLCPVLGPSRQPTSLPA